MEIASQTRARLRPRLRLRIKLAIWIVGTLVAPLAAGAPEPASYFYKVTLSAGMERGKVQSKVRRKRRIRFKIKPFAGKVKKYQVFLVLDAKESAVVAETVVTRLRKKSGLAMARVVRLADGYKVKDLTDKTLIRLEDLRESMGNSLLFRENPLVHAGYRRSSFLFSAANVATGASINPLALSSAFYVEGFLPKAADLTWLNWLGVRFIQESVSPATLRLRRATNDRTEEATLAGNRSKFDLVLQPWFDRFFLYHLALVVGIYHRHVDTLTVGDPAGDGTLIFEQRRSFTSLGLQVAFNPTPKLYAGVAWEQALSHTVSVAELTPSGALVSEGFGRWQNQQLRFWGQVLQPVSDGFKAHARLILNRSTDTISDAASIGSGDDHSIVDWGVAVEVGLVYAPFP